MALTSICGLGQARADPGAERIRTLARAVREDARMIEFTLDGRRASASEGELLVHAAARNGVFIPTLCHDDKLAPVRRLPHVRRRRRRLAAADARLRDARHGRHDGLHELERAAAPEDADRDAPLRAPERRPRRAAERAHRPRRRARRRGAVDPPGREARAVRRPQQADGLRAGHLHPLQPLRPLHAGGDAVLGAVARGPRARGADRPDLGQDRWLDTECELCGGCLSTCPTGAIYEKFLEDARASRSARSSRRRRPARSAASAARST